MPTQLSGAPWAAAASHMVPFEAMTQPQEMSSLNQAMIFQPPQVMLQPEQCQQQGQFLQQILLHQQQHGLMVLQQQPQQPPQPTWQPTVVRASGALAARPTQDAASADAQLAVAAAVQSLYQDQLKPYGRILRKRLDERAGAAGRPAPEEAGGSRLRSFCESCPSLSVQTEEGGDWFVLARGVPDAFVDVYDSEDGYPAEMWSALGDYLESPVGAGMSLPGGRYSCAHELATRRLPFLAGLSLGQVCHVVQLAISQRKLLGYLDGAVVPYCRSQSLLKQRCAERQLHVTAPKGAALATWDTLRGYLSEAIDRLAPGESIPLSNLKRMFRGRCRVELSETSLGHSKLSELLRDERVSDLCCVRLHNQGYVLFPPGEASAPPSLICLADSLFGEPSGSTGAAASSSSSAGEVCRGRGKPAELSLDFVGGEEETTFPPTPDSDTPHWHGLIMPRSPGLWKRGGSDGTSSTPLGASSPRSEDSAPVTQAPCGQSMEDLMWRVPLLSPSTMD